MRYQAPIKMDSSPRRFRVLRLRVISLLFLRKLEPFLGWNYGGLCLHFGWCVKCFGIGPRSGLEITAGYSSTSEIRVGWDGTPKCFQSTSVLQKISRLDRVYSFLWPKKAQHDDGRNQAGAVGCHYPFCTSAAGSVAWCSAKRPKSDV